MIRYSDGFYLEDQDMFNFSGIFRDVVLYSVPSLVSIQDFQWRTSTVLEGSMQSCDVEVDVVLLWDKAVIERLVDGAEGAHTASYRAQLGADWVVSASVYREGIMVSSSETATSHR